jgi:hypothetical protein
VTEPAVLTSTRVSYDAIAADAAEQWKDELAGQPLDRFDTYLATSSRSVVAASTTSGGSTTTMACR